MNKGNAIVEFILGLSVFSLSLTLFLSAVNASLVKWAVLESAQLGTDLQALTDLPPSIIETILRDDLKNKNLPGKPEWFIDMTPPSSSAARFYNLVQTKVSALLPGHLTLEESVASQKEPYE